MAYGSFVVLIVDSAPGCDGVFPRFTEPRRLVADIPTTADDLDVATDKCGGLPGLRIRSSGDDAGTSVGSFSAEGRVETSGATARSWASMA